ncbi:hypothetical protein F5Y16DRAFT_394487 [Xylariaceae sp. FL0255]|nr:hypothetical protein F5Y16DRAFT_394487 [Xylariaceae sp. FL0255]
MNTAGLTQHLKRKHSGDHTERTPNAHQESNCEEISAVEYTDCQGNSAKAEVITASPDRASLAPTTEFGNRTYDEQYFKQLYSVEPDFTRLGQQYPQFGALLKGGSHLDFTDPKSVTQLTKTLLAENFGLKIDLPPNRLCPAVPNRHNYILWLKDLIDSSSLSYSDQVDWDRRVTGLDIGTGASLIYPLLGCVQRPWHFIATDIDPTSLSYARRNARINDLQSRIQILDRTASDSLIPLDDLDLGSIDFVMVNPPFYSSYSELEALAAKKQQPPNSACTGAPIEMVCEGGEVAFVQRLIKESTVLKERVQWYTAMLGKQSSLETLVNRLKEHSISNYAIKAFIQGNKTRRWAMAWSFINRRPSLNSSRGIDVHAAKSIMPSPTEMIINAYLAGDPLNLIDRLEKIIDDAMTSLDLTSWNWDEKHHRGIGFSPGNVWSRAYRRRKARGELRETAAVDSSPSDVLECKFGFSISLAPQKQPDNSGTASVVVRWHQGDDYSVFESFVGIVRSRIRAEA